MLLPQYERPSFKPVQKKQTKLQFCTYWSLCVWKGKCTTKDSARNDSRHSLPSICSSFLHEGNFDFQGIFPNIWKFPPTHRVYYVAIMSCMLVYRHDGTLTGNLRKRDNFIYRIFGQCSLLQRGISSRTWRATFRSVKWTSWSQHRNQLPPPSPYATGSKKEASEKFIILRHIFKIFSLCLTKQISSEICQKSSCRTQDLCSHNYSLCCWIYDNTFATCIIFRETLSICSD